jgi:hypothetical protein
MTRPRQVVAACLPCGCYLPRGQATRQNHQENCGAQGLGVFAGMTTRPSDGRKHYYDTPL